MGDVFKEQIVRKKPTGMDNLIKMGMLAAFVVVCLAVFLFVPSTYVWFFTIAGLGFGIFYLAAFFNVEYEYIFTNDHN